MKPYLKNGRCTQCNTRTQIASRGRHVGLCEDCIDKKIHAEDAAGVGPLHEEATYENTFGRGQDCFGADDSHCRGDY